MCALIVPAYSFIWTVLQKFKFDDTVFWLSSAAKFLAAVALPQTLLGELTALPGPLARLSVIGKGERQKQLKRWHVSILPPFLTKTDQWQVLCKILISSCAEMYRWLSPGAYLQELCIPMENVSRSSLISVRIDCRYPADKGTDINRPWKFCFLQVCSVEQSATCPVWQYPLSGHVWSSAFRTVMDMCLFLQFWHHLKMFWLA